MLGIGSREVRGRVADMDIPLMDDSRVFPKIVLHGKIHFHRTSRGSPVLGDLQLFGFELRLEVHRDAVRFAAAVKRGQARDIGRHVVHAGAGEIELRHLEADADRRHGRIRGIDRARFSVQLDCAASTHLRGE